MIRIVVWLGTALCVPPWVYAELFLVVTSTVSTVSVVGIASIASMTAVIEKTTVMDTTVTAKITDFP